jgi:hypothetical protein
MHKLVVDVGAAHIVTVEFFVWKSVFRGIVYANAAGARAVGKNVPQHYGSSDQDGKSNGFNQTHNTTCYYLIVIIISFRVFKDLY